MQDDWEVNFSLNTLTVSVLQFFQNIAKETFSILLLSTRMFVKQFVTLHNEQS